MSCEWTAYVDGAARSNPGGGGIGVLLRPSDGDTIEISQWIHAHDNNYAEYAALLVALAVSSRYQCRRLQVFSDSQVVVRQISGQYRCQSPALRRIHEHCQNLIRGFEQFTIEHIRREQNYADRLAHAAMESADRELAAPVICPDSLLNWALADVEARPALAGIST
jgi:ribonuclease HI